MNAVQNPYVQAEITRMISIIQDKASNLPIAVWVNEAVDNGFAGAIWFKYEYVTVVDMQRWFVPWAEQLLGPEFVIVIDNDYVCVYRTEQFTGIAQSQRVPLIRAVLQPF